MGLKEDRRKTSKAVVKPRYKGRVNRKEVDISGYDTKNGRKVKMTRKVHKGPRGGTYVIVNGRKRYI